jgi:hypothetical protein
VWQRLSGHRTPGVTLPHTICAPPTFTNMIYLVGSCSSHGQSCPAACEPKCSSHGQSCPAARELKCGSAPVAAWRPQSAPHSDAERSSPVSPLGPSSSAGAAPALRATLLDAAEAEAEEEEDAAWVRGRGAAALLSPPPSPLTLTEAAAAAVVEPAALIPSNTLTKCAPLRPRHAPCCPACQHPHSAQLRVP